MKKLFVIMLALAAMLCAGASAEADALRLPEDLKVVESQAFCGADGFVKAELPYGLKEIHAKAFADSSLTELNIPATVTYIADDAFDGCDIGLVTVSDGSYGEEYCVGKGFSCRTLTAESAFTVSALGNGECEITGCTSTDADIIIPGYIDGMRVVSIGNKAFYNNSALQRVEIPESVTKISDYAFHWCWARSSVVMHDDVTSIGQGAFFRCQSLSEIEIPAGLKSLGTYAFADCAIAKAIVPDAIAELPEGAFRDCRQLKEVSLPERMTAIGEDAFAYSGIEYIVIPEGVTVLEENVFSGCYSLVEVVLPQSLTAIGNSAFRGADSLSYADIPYSVTSIGDYAFDGCTGLQLVGLPGTIQTMGYSAFNGVDDAFFITERDCAALDYCKANYKMIILEPNAESDFTVKNLTGATCRITGYKGSAVDVFLPETIGGRTVTEIGASAFKDKTKIESVSILNYVDTIGSKAFYGCTNLSYMQITSLATDIADNAFDGCDSLDQILVLEFAEAAALAEPALDVPAVADAAVVALD